MELGDLEAIARLLFEILPESIWRGKQAEEIEGELQKVVSQLGNLVMGQYVWAARIAEIEEEVENGGQRCECGGNIGCTNVRSGSIPKGCLGGRK